MPNVPPIAEAMDSLRSAVSQMQARNDFDVVFDEWTRLDRDDLFEWEEWIRKQPMMSNYRIPSALRSIYEATGGFSLRWQYLRDRSQMMVGEAQLVTILELYQRDDEARKPLTDIYHEPRRFDLIDGGATFVGLLFSQDSNDVLTMVHVDGRQQPNQIPLDLDPTAYIRRLADCVALSGWQSAYIAGRPLDTEHKMQLNERLSTLRKCLEA